MSFIDELKRRNVIRVAIVYAVAAWLLIEIVATTFPILHLPDWSVTLVTVLILIGFPLALILAWAFELTPEGLKKDKDVDRNRSMTPVTGRRLDFAIIALLVVTLGYFAYDKFVASPVELQDSIKSIAVLAFDNMSEDPDNEYISDGISEDILNLLTQIPELRVTSRTSAFSFKGKDATIAEIGRTLGVEHVLEGSVRRSGDTIRITAQLINVSTDTLVWSKPWDRSFADVFVIQDEIADLVVDGLKIQLLGEAPHTDTTSPEAYAMYLQSKALADQFTATGFLQAEAVVRRVLEIDSAYAPAWVQLANIYLVGSSSVAWQPREGYAKSRAAAMEALRLNPDSAQAHATLGSIAAIYDYDLETAHKELELALTLAPHDPGVIVNVAWMALRSGDYAEAIRLFKELGIIDPVSVGPKVWLGRSLIRMDRITEAKSSFAEALELRPAGKGVYFYLGSVALVSGDLDDALLQMNKEPQNGLRLAGRAMVLHAMGDTGSAAAELEKLIAIGDRGTYEIAQVHAYFGNLDESFRWLDRAIDRRDTSLNTIVGDPFLDNLLDDPRFDAVLERLGRKIP